MMRRTVAAIIVAVVTFAAGSPLPFGNNCCCKNSCPMKRAAQMHCTSGESCTLSHGVITTTIADAVLAPVLRLAAPTVPQQPRNGATPQLLSQDSPPDTPPPRV